MSDPITTVTNALDAYVFDGYRVIFEHPEGTVSLSHPLPRYDKAYQYGMRHAEQHLDTIARWDIGGNPPKEQE